MDDRVHFVWLSEWPRFGWHAIHPDYPEPLSLDQLERVVLDKIIRERRADSASVRPASHD